MVVTGQPCGGLLQVVQENAPDENTPAHLKTQVQHQEPPFSPTLSPRREKIPRGLRLIPTTGVGKQSLAEMLLTSVKSENVN